MGSCDNGSVIVDGTATEVEAALVAERHLVGELALGCGFATHDLFVDNLVEIGPEMKSNFYQTTTGQFNNFVIL